MSRELERLVNSLVPFEYEASEICKSMVVHLDKVREGFDDLSVICARIHKRYKRVASKFDFEHFDKISELYLALNNTMLEWGNNFERQTQNFFENTRMMFDFSLSELEGLEELIRLRNGFSLEYKESKVALESKKEQLFEAQDFKKWELGDDVKCSTTDLINNKNVAKKYMLPTVSNL